MFGSSDKQMLVGREVSDDTLRTTEGGYFGGYVYIL